MQSHRLRHLAILLSPICLLASLAHAGWRWINPYPTVNDHEACWFTSADTGYTAGWFGMVLKTCDGGQTWSWHETGTAANLTDIAFVGDTGYARGAVFLKTFDGGANWAPMNPETLPGFLSFPEDSRVGFAAGTGMEGLILRTTDGGEHWTDSYHLGGTEFFVDIQFLNNSIGCAVGGKGGVSDSGVICRTTDGGLSWSRRVINRLWLTGVSFAGSGETGMVCSNDAHVLRTTDGGSSWVRVDPSTTDALSAIVLFPDCATAVLSTSDGRIFRTTNAGTNWTRAYSSTSVIKDLSFPHLGSVGYALGHYGVLLKTTDQGVTWVDLVRGPRDYFYEVEFPAGPDTGFVFGSYPYMTWKTTDGGATWERLSTDSTRTNLESVSIPGRQTRVMFGVGYGDGIWRTGDGGAHWEKSPIEANRELKSVDFPVDTLTGYAVAHAGYIYKTTDGDTWMPLVSGVTTDFEAVQFPQDTLTGYAVGLDGAILKTTNCGDTWCQLNSGVTRALFALDFPIDAETGYVVGSPPALVLKTTDGGASWVNKLSGGSEALKAVSFPAGCRIGFAVSANGVIFRTTDGGEDWVSTRFTHLPIFDVTFPPGNTDTGYAVGQRGLILRTTDGGGTWLVEQNPTLSPTGSAPLTATVIRGVLMMGRQFTAGGSRQELLDAVGRRVMELRGGANDVSRLAPGVYFVRDVPSTVGGQRSASSVRKVIITD